MRPGDVREEVWGALMRARAVGYPLPPHGHHPNFTGAARAAEQLLEHPALAGLDVLAVGPERALAGLRKRALAQGRVVVVPDGHREGRFWRLSGDPRGADLKLMPSLGEPVTSLEGVRGAVLACVAADLRGGRLSKGFGWGARGLGLGVPEFTLAHALMLREELPCEPDSRVCLVATPDGVHGASPS
ncbi:hypothetical protein [Deinococcus pimensis]|uniref:hypothetical protein n=1 Tax=Deinococcus pimensis TaxID=309888 RepID=UPI000487119C|nr:hypothetical protein [Deinococcus pimensis]